MLSKFNNKKHRRLTALLLCVALMLGSVTSVSADISAADSETEAQSGVQTYAEESTAEAVSYEAPETQAEVQEETSVAEETEAPAADTQQTEAHTEATTEAHTETAAETQAAETTETEVETETETEVVAQQLEYEDDQVKVHVTASEEGIIPDHASLKVVPLVKQEVTNEMTDEQKQEVEAINKKYDEAEKKLTEKAEKEAYDIAGFLAYDISLVDADGNKVEPNGDVKVTMDYKQPVIADEAVQAVENTDGIESTADLDVTVMHLEEDEQGQVKDVVDMVADENTEANLETTDDQNVQKAEFVSDSFSTFTLTWKNSNAQSKATATIHLVDTKGNDIGGSQDNLSVTSAKVLQDIAPQISGYTYEKAMLSSYNNGTEITEIKAEKQSYYYWSAYYWYYKTKTDSNNWENTSKGEINIYLVYEKISGLYIEDDIVKTGALIAKYMTNTGTTEPKINSYEWYRSDSKEGEYAKVEKVNYQASATDIKSNLSDNCSQLYPAYDEGARKWYKVKAILDGGTSIESKPFQVNYYNQLQNGSFENPEGNYQWSNADYKAEGVWQTTGIGTGNKEGADIEIVNPSINTSGYSDYSWVGGKEAWKKAAYDKDQFAELNCEAAGALYQDVLTKEGTSLNYWLAHRARGNNANATQYDTMFLVIMPTKTAQDNDLTTQKKLEDYLSGLEVQYGATDSTARSEQVYNQNGIMVLRVTSSNQAWQYIKGINGYTATSSLTRFFFMSGKTASGNNTVGNFLDQVGFSQQLPPVADDEFSLQIRKDFNGLGNADISKVKDKIRFKISATKNGVALTDEQITELFGRTSISGKDMKQEMDGSLVYTLNNRKIKKSDTYQVTITEEKAELEGYTLTASAQTSVQIDNADPTTKDGSVISELKGKVTAIVSFTNEYEENNFKKIHFTKVWDDANNNYQTRPESLNVTLHATYLVTENGETRTEPLNLTGKVTPSATVTLNEAGNWKCSWEVPVYYKLDNGTKVKINYSITEGDNNSAYVYEAVTNNGKAIQGNGSAYKETFSTNGITTESVAGSSSKRRAAAKARTATNQSADTAVLAADNTSNAELGEPAHKKYIDYNEASGDYTLNLDVTGARGSAPGVDVLFVIDTSGSMGTKPSDVWWGGNYYNLLPTVKSLLTKQDGIVDKIFASAGNKNSVAFVSFSDKDGTKSTSWYGTSGKDDFKEKVNKLSATGGTNWTYAMVKARDVLARKANSGNDKVVIFLSDGKPTYSYVQQNGKWKETGDGSNTENSYYQDAADQVTGSLANAKLYSVYLTSATQDGMKTFSDKLSNSDLVDGTNLDTALTNILNKTIPTYKNVTITDTLSEYVDFAESTPTITVTEKTKSGSVTTLVNGTDYSAGINDKTVTVNLLGGRSLEDGSTYTVSFRVKPSNKANQDYATNKSYPDTGDAGTGITSAGKTGFYSNNDARTKLTYEIDGTTDGEKTASYQKPVVQVTTHTLSYRKVWKHPEGVAEPAQNVILNVNYTDGSTGQVTLTKAGKYSFQETVPVTKSIASITEETINDYEASYSITDNGTNAVVTNNYQKVTASSITVKKEWVGDGPKSDVTVSLYQNVNDGEAKLYETVTLNESNGWTKTWDRLPQYEGSSTGQKTYSYSVREENIPTNYQSSISYEYGNDQITATIKNTYDPNCADENYYIANVLQTEKLHITKIWDDSDNAAGLRPDELSVNVDGMNFTLSGNDNWTKATTILKKKNRSHSATEELTGNYHQVGNAEITEAADGVSVIFTNKLNTTKITVKKNWNDGNVSDRPNSVKFRLEYRTADTSGNWQEYDVYTLTGEDITDTDGWVKVIHNLPTAYEYRVVELADNGEPATASNYGNYVPTVKQDGTTYTMTNTLKWSAMKVSEEWDESNTNSVGLEGAEFELKLGDTVIATGESKAGGSITWTVKNSNSTTDLYNLNGTYTIHETKAPTGYMLHEDWSVTFTNGLLTTVDGKNITGSAADGVVIKLADKKVYVLPETGGSGIYWFSICGMLLMMAAAWIIYKNKCREVLVK